MTATDTEVANESVDLLSQLIRNECVNDGTPESGFESRSADLLAQYLGDSGLDLVADLPGVRLGLPAHGHPFDDVPGRVDAIKRHHQERMDLLGAASVALGPASVQELSHELFPKKHWGVMAESATFAHLEHLVLEGRAERHRENGKLIYTVAPAS